MKTTFTTEDGVTFDTIDQASEREAYVAAIKEVNARLPMAIDSGCEFANGGGYVQHTAKQVYGWLTAVETILQQHEGDEMADRWKQNPRGIVGRYLDEGNSPAYRCVMRIMSIDSDFREWGHPYYAMNPGKGTMKPWPNVNCLKPEDKPKI